MEAGLAQVGKVLKNVSKQIKDQAQEFMSHDKPLENKLKEATANTNWGCATTILADIARMAQDYHDYSVIMKVVWDSIAAKPKYWRKVFKTLTLLDYLIRLGPERVVEEVRDYLYRLRYLSGFHYTEEGWDKGNSVRQKAKEIIDLIGDTERLRNEREKARLNRERFVGMGGTGEISSYTTGLSTQFYSTGGIRDTHNNNNNMYSDKMDSPIKKSQKTSPTIVDDDLERELQRVVMEKENSRKARERKRHKTEAKKQEKQRKSKKSVLSSDSEISEGSDTKIEKQTDFFNIDAGWDRPKSQGFEVNFPNKPPLTPNFPQSSLNGLAFPPMTTNKPFPSMTPDSSKPDYFFNQNKTFNNQSSISSCPLYSQNNNSYQPFPSLSMQSLMEQNLTKFMSEGQQPRQQQHNIPQQQQQQQSLLMQQPSKNPFNF